MARLNYVEVPVRDVAEQLAFYEAAFGWSFTEFGPTYAATTTGDVDVGFQGDPAEATVQMLPVIQVDDLEAVLEKVTAAGGTVTKPVFSFPGGRRFHFRDPAGHEFAAMVPEAHIG